MITKGERYLQPSSRALALCLATLTWSAVLCLAEVYERASMRIATRTRPIRNKNQWYVSVEKF